jgi:hypothetical protein
MSLAHALLDQILQQVTFGGAGWLLGRVVRAAVRRWKARSARGPSSHRQLGDDDPASARTDRATPGPQLTFTREQASVPGTASTYGGSVSSRCRGRGPASLAAASCRAARGWRAVDALGDRSDPRVVPVRA